MSEQMTTSAASGPVKRSKRLYVYWGIALTLLLSLGTFCWFVVAPVWRARDVAREIWTKHSSPTAKISLNEVVAMAAIKRLGGRDQAVRCLRLYLLAPERIAEHKQVAACLLGYCGPPAVPVLAGALTSNMNWYARAHAARSLGRIGPEAGEAVPALIEALKDARSNGFKYDAIRALGKIGRGARAAIPTLTGILNDQKEEMGLRRRAAEALRVIRGPGEAEEQPR